MFSGQTNPYDELVNKATDENLASENWDINLQICDKVTEQGTPGARNVVASLVKRLSHRNPNVQIYALELANTLAQNCGKPLQEELASRTWTGALERILNDRATVKPVEHKVLKYVKEWTQQFEAAGDPNLGLMSELYDKLREKNYTFDDVEEQPDAEEARRRAEEEELARVLELSKQDKGGRAGASPQPPGQGSSSAAGVGGVAGAAAAVGASGFASGYGGPPSYQGQPPQQQQPAHSQQSTSPYPQPQAYTPYQPQVQQAPTQSTPPAGQSEAPLDINTATRVRALYTFKSSEVGELSFERGDVIKVLDRGFEEWWRGASNGLIGIFPVTYVEALPEPTMSELQEEAQEEARVFASLGLVDQLLKTLKGIDPSRGDRLEDRPDIEEMYQASVALQGQINALIKKYSDQKAELEHMNTNFVRAMRQYEELRGAPPAQQYGQQPYPAQGGYQAPPNQGHPPYAYGQGPPAASPSAMPPAQQPQYPVGPQSQQPPQQTPPAQGYYQQPNTQSTSSLPGSQPGSGQYGSPQPHPQAHPPHPQHQGSGPDPNADHQAAWDEYYRQQGQQPPHGQPPHGQPPHGQPPHGQHPPPGVPGAPPAPYGQPQQAPYGYPQQGSVDGVTNQMGHMSVGQ